MRHLYRLYVWRARQVPAEPLAPAGEPSFRERAFGRIAGMNDGSSIAEALAAVFAPSPRTRFRVAGAERALSPFRRPATLTARRGVPLRCEDVFPVPADAVAQPHPDEVKQLVDENARVLVEGVREFFIQDDQTLPDESRRMGGIA